MKTSPSRSKHKPRRRRRFTSNELLVVIGVILIITSLLVGLIRGRQVVKQKAKLTACKGNVKIMGLVLTAYYNDVSNVKFGEIVANNRVEPSLGGYGFDPYGHSCPAKKTGGNESGYVFDRNTGNVNTFLFPIGKETAFTKEDTWAVVNNPNSPLLHDKETKHWVNGKTNIAVGDGHVEEK